MITHSNKGTSKHYLNIVQSNCTDILVWLSITMAT